MKRLIYFLCLITSLTGCVSTEYFYQMYKTESDNLINSGKGTIIFQSNFIDIYSDFWSDGGNGSFMIYNKTDSNLYLDLGKSHLIINGLAQTYFQNRIFSKSSSSSISIGSSYTTGYANKYTSYASYGGSYAKYSGITATSAAAATNATGFSVSYGEIRIICIPPKSGKAIDGFALISTPYRDCDLYRFPSKKSQPSKKFTNENSPLKFTNSITFGFDEEVSNPIIVELSFWVSEIDNFIRDNFIGIRQIEYCGQKSLSKEDYYNYENPQYFFIRYTKSIEDIFEH